LAEQGIKIAKEAAALWTDSLNSPFPLCQYKQRVRQDGEKYNDIGIRNRWLKINKSNRDTYPNDYEQELKNYEKNIDQLN
jgi:hypothetical protein